MSLKTALLLDINSGIEGISRSLALIRDSGYGTLKLFTCVGTPACWQQSLIFTVVVYISTFFVIRSVV